jgi:hypothetical protein
MIDFSQSAEGARQLQALSPATKLDVNGGANSRTIIPDKGTLRAHSSFLAKHRCALFALHVLSDGVTLHRCLQVSSPCSHVRVSSFRTSCLRCVHHNFSL